MRITEIRDPTSILSFSWNSNAVSWTQAVRNGGIPSRRLVTDRAIVDAVLAQATNSLLDVGCGEGWLCRALARHVPRIVGIDGSAELIAQARDHGGAEFAHVRYNEIKSAEIFHGCYFDTVVANFALLDDDLSGFLETMRSLVSETGTLVIQTLHPSSAAPPYRDGWRVEDFSGFDIGMTWQPMPWHFYTLSSWISALSPHWNLRDLAEPLHPETDLPASLILVADPS